MTSPEISVVVPVFNERDNITPLVDEIVAALRGLVAFEILCVDDHSSDDTLAMLQALKAGVPELRVLHHVSQSGQSTAVRNGIKAARGTWIATLDGDGQNDPADIPKLLAARDAAAPQVKLFAGWQSTSVPVAHRPRTAGVSKYNNLGRALVGIRDLLGVSWLIARSRRTTVEER